MPVISQSVRVHIQGVMGSDPNNSNLTSTTDAVECTLHQLREHLTEPQPIREAGGKMGATVTCDQESRWGSCADTSHHLSQVCGKCGAAGHTALGD